MGDGLCGGWVEGGICSMVGFLGLYCAWMLSCILLPFADFRPVLYLDGNFFDLLEFFFPVLVTFLFLKDCFSGPCHDRIFSDILSRDKISSSLAGWFDFAVMGGI